jgi:hypothetical protein
VVVSRENVEPDVTGVGGGGHMFLILEQDTRCCCVKEFTPYRQMMQVFDANEIVSCRKRMQPYDQRKPTKISRVLAYTGRQIDISSVGYSL